MLIRSLAMVAPVSLIAACGEGDGARAAERPPERSEVALAANARSASLRPGLYRVIQTGDVELEDERCILASDVAAGRFAAGELVPSGWTVETNRMSGGTIALAARHPVGGRIALSGSYQVETFRISGTLDLPVKGEQHHVRVTAQGDFQSPDCDDAEDVDG